MSPEPGESVISHQLERLQAAADSLLERSQNGTPSDLALAVEKATGVTRLVFDLAKSQAETKKIEFEQLRLKLEYDTASRRKRFAFLKESGPFLTIVTLASTLLWQSWQFTQTEKDKRDAAEDAQWAEAVRSISQTSKLSPAVITLNPFLKSARYGDLARETAIQLLANSSDLSFFTDLFGAAFVPVSSKNLDQILRMDRALYARVLPLYNKTYDAKTDSNDETRLDPQERATYNYGTEVFHVICEQVASVLRTPRQSGSTLDFSGAYFKSCSWRDADLSGTNITNTELAWLDLSGARLDKITKYDGAYFYHVTWWDAETIRPNLLDYLEKNSDAKYDPNAKYGPGLLSQTVKVTQEHYNAALARLKRGTG